MYATIKVIGLIILFILLFIGAVSQLTSKRGIYGERLVRLILALLPSEYHKLNDVRLNVCGRKCQIDHLIVSPYGIFVIETKSYLGLTYGDSKDNKWNRRVLGKRYKIRNPLLQNQYHLEMLNAKLCHVEGFSDEWLKSIVVFTFGSWIRISGESKNVVMFYNLLPFLKHDKTLCIPPRSMDEILLMFKK